jgi:hypothetical protein
MLTHYRGNRGIQTSHLWLCCSPLVFRTMDYGLTLYAQPTAYWQGNYHMAREGSTVLLWCLRWHPLAFVAAAVVVSLVFSLLILCWPTRLARFLAAVLTFGHIYGIATWILASGALGWTACVAMLYYSWAMMNTTWQKQQEAERRGMLRAMHC